MNKKAISVLKKGSGLFLALLTAFGVSCGKKNNEEKTANYELWSAAATEKILKNVNVSEYEEIREDANLSIDTAKNEYEGAQVIISATDAVKKYTVEVSDLKREGGEEVYAKENVAVYNMKYTNVSSTWNEGTRIGWYPDAILPFDAAVKAGENKVTAGENQSVYFSFETPIDQAAGTYTGSVTLTVDGEKNKIPVSVRVRNVTVNEEVHNKSCFLTSNWYTYLGEYDSTQGMLDKYTKMLLKYRLAPGTLVADTAHQPEDAAYYAEKVYELCANEQCSTIFVPTRKSAEGIPGDTLTMYLSAIVEKSLETKYNLVEKCYVYGIDEPIQNNALEKTKNFALDFNTQRLDTYNNFLENKENYLAEHTDVDEAYYEEILASIMEVRYLTTTKYYEPYEDYVDIWCPHFHTFEEGLTTGVYENEDKMWFYGCLMPKAPYPTYHIDDKLVSARMIGWLQALYNVEGNLYWAANNYARYDGSYSYLDEYYENPNHYRYVPGEGFLMYPGKKYGVDGPLASMRLEAIRDGNEEYELLYNIKEAYASVSKSIGVDFSAENTIASLMSALHSGMRVTATCDTFAEARSQLLSLSEFTQSGVCITDYKDDGEGIIDYTLYVPDGVTVDVSGISKISESTVFGGKLILYRADMKKENAVSTATFETKVNGEKVSVNFALSGKVSKYEAETLIGGYGKGGATLVDALAISGEAGKLAQIATPKATDTARALVRFADSALLSRIGEQTDKVVFKYWYNGSAQTLPVNMYIKYKNKQYEETIGSATYQFKQGANEIVWNNLTQVNWEKNGKIEYIAFEIGELGAAAHTDLYMKSVVIYSVREDT